MGQVGEVERAPAIFMARTGVGEEQEVLEQVYGRERVLAYKIIPGLITPGRLPIECFPASKALFDKRPELVGQSTR